MKIRAVVLIIMTLTVCAAMAANGDSISLSENWYIKITNFSLQGETTWPHSDSINHVGFSDIYGYQYSTTGLIEPKLGNPLSDGSSYNALIFDFHAGQADTNDVAWYCPWATLGTEWAATISFHWQIYCSDPNVRFRVNTNAGGPEYSMVERASEQQQQERRCVARCCNMVVSPAQLLRFVCHSARAIVDIGSDDVHGWIYQPKETNTLRQHMFVFFLLACILIVSAQDSFAAITSQNVLIVYNATSSVTSSSEGTAKYYAFRRDIPSSNLLGISAATCEEVSATNYVLLHIFATLMRLYLVMRPLC